MSFPYEVFFTRCGCSIASLNSFVATQGTLLSTAANCQNYFTNFGTEPALMGNLAATFDGFAAATVGWSNSIIAVANAVIADQQSFFNASSPSPSVILPLLVQQMVIDSQTVLENTIGAPTIAIGTGSVGNGTLIADINDWNPFPQQAILAQQVRLQCTRDQFTGSSAGAEQFTVIGYPATGPQYYGQQGNGNGPRAVVANVGSNLLQNGGFDVFTVTNTPNNWTIVAGTVGTNIFKSAVTHSHGAASLLLQGNSSAATVTLTQAVGVSNRTKYGFAFWLKKGAGTFAGGSNLKISIYSPSGQFFYGSTTEIPIFNADPTTLTTTYALSKISVNVGATPPTDSTVRITWTGAGSEATTAQIFIDDGVFTTGFYYGSVFYYLNRGTTDFLQNDFIASATTNAYNGLFSTFFGQVYGIQFPLVASSPTISESWVPAV